MSENPRADDVLDSGSPKTSQPEPKAKANMAPKRKAQKEHPIPQGPAKRKAKRESEATPDAEKPNEPQARKSKGGEKEQWNDGPNAARKKGKGENATTWGGRWISSQPFALKKMTAIRTVFEEHVAPQLQTQSRFQSPFFTHCQRAFVETGITEEAPCPSSWTLLGGKWRSSWRVTLCVPCL